MWRQQSEQLEFHLFCPLIINGVPGLLICQCGEMEGCILQPFSSKRTECDTSALGTREGQKVHLLPERTQAENTVSLILASQGKVTWIWKVNKSWEKPISLLISFLKFHDLRDIECGLLWVLETLETVCVAEITLILPRMHCSCVSQMPEKVAWSSHSGAVLQLGAGSGEHTGQTTW